MKNESIVNVLLEIGDFMHDVDNGKDLGIYEISKLAEIARLGRIATALEELNDNLSKITECVGYAPPRLYQKEGYSFIRIGGQVETE